MPLRVIIGLAVAAVVLGLAVLGCRSALDSPEEPIGPGSQLDSPSEARDAVDPLARKSGSFAAPFRESLTCVLKAGQAVEISCAIEEPSSLPPNALLRATWRLKDGESGNAFTYAREDVAARRNAEDLDLRALPSADWSKVLHALDPDVYLVYRAHVTGEYELSVDVIETGGASEIPFGGSVWRENGVVGEMLDARRPAEWPGDADVRVGYRVAPIDPGDEEKAGLFIEAEPNDAPELAQAIPLRETNQSYSLHIVGGSDDIEYFDNGNVGQVGDDWYRLEYHGEEPRLLTACLSIPDQQVVARIRCYALSAEQGKLRPNTLLPIQREYTRGKNINERVHQQTEPHRLAINRTMQPGNVYFLRVEANAPGYELELRVVDPAPFEDPRQAVRHALYDHLGQVDSWLMNRPRAVSVERRIRDTGNLLGSGCMSCHTQAGVWGPAVAFANGYRPENVQLMRNLVNICYQSMRPTNELIDAANNASLAPLDLGDGPAGTRVAGHAAVSFERFLAPRKLQSAQAIRAANNILQTADPSAVNAAGPGANVGQGVVLNYAGEVVWSAWKATGDPKYFRALEGKVLAVLDMKVKFTDDLCHRVELLSRYFPEDYVAKAAEVASRERERPTETNRVPYETATTSPLAAESLRQRVDQQLSDDIARLRATQNDDGSWGFNPGKWNEATQGWEAAESNVGEPSPTALALLALEARGFGSDDEAVQRGVQSLLAMQKPSGYWKGSSLTGFVSTAYALNALARLYPVEPPSYSETDFEAAREESLARTIRRVRDLSATGENQFTPLLLEAAEHESAWVRYWAMIGLGAAHPRDGVETLVRGLGDSAKMVREAAHWGLRQVLIDDQGWPQVLAALRSENDYTREAAARALVMRVDGVLPEISIAWDDLSGALAHAMNQDPHPAVRAWAARAAWNWWYWNPPMRPALNDAWREMLVRREPNRLAENNIRYQSHALFVVNGHHANESAKHQYAELAELFSSLHETLRSAEPEVRDRLRGRLVGIAATYYGTAGGDGGPGQLGYATPGSGALFGQALEEWIEGLPEEVEASSAKETSLQIGLEGSAHIPHDDLQQTLIHYSLNGPERLRTIAASSVSDPRSAQLVAVPEMIEPLVRQVQRGAMDVERRSQLSDPIIKLFERVRWMVPANVEQQQEILGYLIPEFPEYVSREQIAAIENAADRQETDRRMVADTYLAEKLGDVFGANPDLRFDEVLKRFPAGEVNPLAARFWLPSVPWILNYKSPLPELPAPEEIGVDDPYAEYRDRALRLYLAALSDGAHRQTQRLAIDLATRHQLRSRLQVRDALARLEPLLADPTATRTIRNVLAMERELERQLAAAVKREQPMRAKLNDSGDVVLSAEFVEDFRYFRDHVVAEMNRPQRIDQRSCYSCHGVPGRVPSLKLKAPNRVGYLSVTNLLANYRLLQERIDVDSVALSKLLRKPLNIQSGQEDGHQGGLRYVPTDRGYQILERWARNQVKQGFVQ